eukprot:c29296_g2_i1 orf=496-756(-)
MLGEGYSLSAWNAVVLLYLCHHIPTLTIDVRPASPNKSNISSNSSQLTASAALTTSNSYTTGAGKKLSGSTSKVAPHHFCACLSGA